MKTGLIEMPDAEWHWVKTQSPGSAGNETPAPATTGTGEKSASNHQEAEHCETNRPQSPKPGNPGDRASQGYAYRPVIWIPQVDLPLVAEIVRLEGKSRDAELAGNPREAARCHLLAAALTHSMARLACTGAEGIEGMRAQLAEDVDDIGGQVLDSLRGSMPEEIATGYQLDQSAHLYSLSILGEKGGAS